MLIIHSPFERPPLHAHTHVNARKNTSVFKLCGGSLSENKCLARSKYQLVHLKKKMLLNISWAHVNYVTQRVGFKLRICYCEHHSLFKQVINESSGYFVHGLLFLKEISIIHSWIIQVAVSFSNTLPFFNTVPGKLMMAVTFLTSTLTSLCSAPWQR